jgi:uncharacterized protein YndB with AHSA1/START domain
MASSTDRIEKTVKLRATRQRVWRALTDFEEFGAWFRVKLAGPFVAGKSVTGQITYPGYEHLTMTVWVEKMEPEKLFSFRWHPGAVDEREVAGEPTTLVEFALEDTRDGTQLTVIESGFDKLPAARRSEAFRMNDQGWNEQVQNIERHVTAG